MKTKSVSVSKRTTSSEKLKAKLWDEFIKHSSVPWGDLSKEWQTFFYQQGFVESASEQLEELALIAIGEKV